MRMKQHSQVPVASGVEIKSSWEIHRLGIRVYITQMFGFLCHSALGLQFTFPSSWVLCHLVLEFTFPNSWIPLSFSPLALDSIRNPRYYLSISCDEKQRLCEDKTTSYSPTRMNTRHLTASNYNLNTKQQAFFFCY